MQIPASGRFQSDKGPEFAHRIFSDFNLGCSLVGPAFTVKWFVGDLKAGLCAIDLAQPGDVLVIDVGGTTRATAWVGTSALAAKTRGLAGCVTNGSVRNLDELIEIGLAIFAAGVSVRGTVKAHPGWIGITIVCRWCCIFEIASNQPTGIPHMGF